MKTACKGYWKRLGSMEKSALKSIKKFLKILLNCNAISRKLIQEQN